MDATSPEPRSSSSPFVWILLVLVAGAVLSYVAIGTAPRGGDDATKHPAVGRKLQFLRLEGLTGGAAATSLDDLRGRVALVNYWGTWCGPCIIELPHLLKLADTFAAEPDFRFLPVSCGGEADADLDELRTATEAFLAARNLTLATYADQHAASRRAMSILLSLDNFAYPTTLVLDRRGTIRGFWIGYDPRAVDEMTALVRELLAEPTDQAK